MQQLHRIRACQLRFGERLSQQVAKQPNLPLLKMQLHLEGDR